MEKILCALSAQEAQKLIVTQAVRTDNYGQIMWEKLGCSCALLDEIHQYQATHDLKTGLPNLDLMVEQMEKDLQQGRAYGLVFLMVNGLNEIAEHHGIDAGIHVLRTFANRMRETVKEGGFVAHLHGDLFAAISYDADPAKIARQLWTKTVCPISWQGRDHQLIVVAGVVSSKDNPGTAEMHIQAGYAAAKHCRPLDTRGGVHLFTAELGLRIERQYLMDSRLRMALTGQGLSLVMQPKICSLDGRIVGAEALIRWSDVQLGMVSPSEFIPLAERNGTIVEITLWVLEQALRQVTLWRRAGLDLNIAVNLSVIDLHRPNLIDCIHRALLESGCSPLGSDHRSNRIGSGGGS